MNLVCGLPGPRGAWKRAADLLGHQLVEIDDQRRLDAFRRLQPDTVLLEARLVDRVVLTYLQEHPPQQLVLCGDAEPLRASLPAARTMTLRPCLDALPDTPAGCVRPEFACDVAVVAQYRASMDPYLGALAASGLVFKVFGDGPFPVVNYLGSIAPEDIVDAYRSATVTVDLLADPARVLAIWAAGGRAVTTASFQGSGVQALLATPWSSDPAVLPKLVRSAVVSTDWRAHILANDTYTQRLKEILDDLC